MYKLAALVVLVCAGVDGVSFVKLCASEDRACMKESAQAAVTVVAAGVPELDIPSLDPMHLDKVVASQAGLNMDFRDTTVTGLKSCTVENIKRDKVKNKLSLEIHCDVVFAGDYTLSGRLLILPVEGSGKYKIKVKKIAIKISFDMGENTEANGKKYWQISGWKHSYKGLGNAEFRFQNLFNGNKALSDAVHTFANTNWSDILNEVGPPIVRVVVTKIVEAAKVIFSKVPAAELALD